VVRGTVAFQPPVLRVRVRIARSYAYYINITVDIIHAVFLVVSCFMNPFDVSQHSINTVELDNYNTAYSRQQGPASASTVL
jgi:hypothetical protein